MALQEKLKKLNLRLKRNYLDYNARYPMHFLAGTKKCVFVGRNQTMMGLIARSFCKDAIEGKNAIRIEFDLLDAIREGLSLKQLMIQKLERICRDESQKIPARGANDSDYIIGLLDALEVNQSKDRKVILLFLNFQMCVHIIEHGNTPEFIFLREMRNCLVFVSTISMLDLETALGIAYKGNSVLAPCVDMLSLEGDVPFKLSEIQEACKIPNDDNTI